MAATGVVAGSAAANADTGAVRTFPINTLGAGWTSVSYVDAPGNGYVYVHGQRNGDDGYAVVTESGEVIRQAQLTNAGDVTGLAATTDGIMYVCHEEANVIRVDSAGAQTTVGVPGASETWDCRRGTDGAVWFSFTQASDADGLGRVTSSGSLATLDLASQRSDVTNSLYIDNLVPGGATSTVSFVMSENARVAPFDREKTLLGVARYSDANGITLPNVTEWRLAPGVPAPFTTLAVAGSNTYSSGVNQLERLASPPTATAVPVTHNIGGLESGADGTLWASLSTAPVLWHYNTDGQLLGSYNNPTNIPPRRMRIDPAGDLWLVLGQSGFARMSGGATPSVQQQPSTSNAQGSTAGTEITASPGTWTNNPSTYTYQWQECSKADGSDCTDIRGATSEKYTPTDAQAGKYVRVVVTATNISGVSQQAATTPVQVAQRTSPPPPPTTAPSTGGSAVATGATAEIGNSQTMELDVPKKTRRNKRKLYEVFFTATDVPGTVTFTFKRKRRMKTVTVPIEDGIADYRWKTPKKWPRGKTRVTATYVPSAGSPYATAAVTDRVKVRKRKR
ncbi:MAG: hypothetical protein L7U42_04555 [Candidatus Nanopelagicales bacterium]|nr:hypothetical protein [Candidatus Nanopelagicales bacterium]